jgi:plastocyanin
MISTRLIAALAAVAFAAACQPAKAPPKAQTLTMTMQSMAFTPATLTAHVGDSVRWVNNDIVRHNVTARDGRFNFDLDPNQSRTTVLDHAGRVPITCSYHPTMTAVLDVEP